MSLDDTDGGFVDDLKRSQVAVERLALWLQARGYYTQVPELAIRPDVSQRAAYTDGGDLFLLDARRDELGLFPRFSRIYQPTHRVEVKRRSGSYSFTGPNDFGFPTVIVDTAHVHDAADPPSIATFILNGPMSVAMLVRETTKPFWERRAFGGDRIRGREVYLCPLDRVEWYALGG